MISHKHKCIFIHIPKAAGTSIETFFLDDLGLNFEDKHSLIIGKSTNLYLQPRIVSHLTATEMLSQSYISYELFSNYYKFSFTRNPIDRLYSSYKYLSFHSVISFDTFVKKVFLKLTESKKHGFFFKPQTSYLFDLSKNENLMNFTGKMENISSDFQEVISKIDIQKGNLIHTNKSKDKSILRGIKKLIEYPDLIWKINLFAKSKLLSKESMTIIENFYSDDFVNFGYTIK